MLSCVPSEGVAADGNLPRINTQGLHSWRTGSAGPEPSRPAYLSGLLGDEARWLAVFPCWGSTACLGPRI
jgi:hypothetical protein